MTLRLMRDYRSKSHIKVWGIQARNAEQNMALNLLMDPDIDFVTLLGQAGTGKTLMTLAAALTQTIDERRFSEIIMTRATVSVAKTLASCPALKKKRWRLGWERSKTIWKCFTARVQAATGDVRPRWTSLRTAFA